MSTRREFFALMGAGAVTSAATMRAGKPAAAVGCPAERTCVGVATVDSHGGRLKRVWLDGEEVTDYSFYADDAADCQRPEWFGRVKVYRRTANGEFYVWGCSLDPDPATRRDDKNVFRSYHMVDGKRAWNKPYPGYGEVAYDEFTGDVRIVVL